MKRKKKRTGWTTPRTTLDIPKDEIINECLEPKPYWDDWNDSRDGIRGYNDRTRKRLVWKKNPKYVSMKIIRKKKQAKNR